MVTSGRRRRKRVEEGDWFGQNGEVQWWRKRKGWKMELCRTDETERRCMIGRGNEN